MLLSEKTRHTKNKKFSISKKKSENVFAKQKRFVFFLTDQKGQTRSGRNKPKTDKPCPGKRLEEVERFLQKKMFLKKQHHYH